VSHLLANRCCRYASKFPTTAATATEGVHPRFQRTRVSSVQGVVPEPESCSLLVDRRASNGRAARLALMYCFRFCMTYLPSTSAKTTVRYAETFLHGPTCPSLSTDSSTRMVLQSKSTSSLRNASSSPLRRPDAAASRNSVEYCSVQLRSPIAEPARQFARSAPTSRKHVCGN
jgi:hypothetical protein